MYEGLPGDPQTSLSALDSLPTPSNPTPVPPIVCAMIQHEHDSPFGITNRDPEFARIYLASCPRGNPPAPAHSAHCLFSRYAAHHSSNGFHPSPPKPSIRSSVSRTYSCVFCGRAVASCSRRRIPYDTYHVGVAKSQRMQTCQNVSIWSAIATTTPAATRHARRPTGSLPGTHLGRLGVGDDVRVRHAQDAREDEAHLVLCERLRRRVVHDWRDHTRRGEACGSPCQHTQ